MFDWSFVVYIVMVILSIPLLRALKKRIDEMKEELARREKQK